MSSNGKTLLLIDDDADLVRAYVEILKEEGYEAKGISDARVGLKMLEQGPLPKILFVDCRMPGMNGSSFLKLLFEKIPNVRSKMQIYGFSAMGEGSDLVQELTQYVLGFLEKPTDLFELVDLVKKLFDKAIPVR